MTPLSDKWFIPPASRLELGTLPGMIWTGGAEEMKRPWMMGRAKHHAIRDGASRLKLDKRFEVTRLTGILILLGSARCRSKDSTLG